MNDNKLLMDAFDAPQWTDFTSSPQVSDDFFNRLHPEHELEYQRRQLFTTQDDSGFDKILNDIDITPIKVLSPSKKSHKDNKTPSTKEKTVSNLLLEAMGNLELSSKKVRLNHSTANSSLNTCKTPNTSMKRITRSMSARKQCEYPEETCLNTKENELKLELPVEEVSAHNNLKVESSEECDSNKNKSENDNSAKLMPGRVVLSFEKRTKDQPQETNNDQEIIKEVQVPDSVNIESLETETDEQLLEPQKMDEIDPVVDKKLLPGRLVTSFNLGKPKESKIPEVVTKKRPHLLTSIRRQSFAKQKRDPYVSLAEAVSKFQKGTPKRFHSVSTKNPKQKPAGTSNLKITRPVSPVLTSKNRIRPIKPLNNDKKENTDLKRIRNGPVKADPRAISVAKNTAAVKNITKKPTTLSTAHSKRDQFSSSESLSTCKSQNLQDSHLRIDQPVQKKVVPTIVSTEGAKLAVKEVEIGHFGIPTESCYKHKKITRTLPFSFEVRNKELQAKKELKLKNLQLEKIEKGKKTECNSKPEVSHAIKGPLIPKKKDFISNPGSSRTEKASAVVKLQKIETKPVPNIGKKVPAPTKIRITPLKNPKESVVVKKTTPRPFSFEQRDKQLIKKKEDFIKEALEKERKGREFHANPVPEFRPVIVRGRSKENIRVEDKTPPKNTLSEKVISRPKSCSFKSNLFRAKNNDDQENQNPIKQRSNSASNINVKRTNLNFGSDKKIDILSELNTNKRAKDRKEYYDKLKRKEIEEGFLRKQEEEERLLREKAELVELRKMTEIRARPMPQYKPMIVIKSKKLLTDPQSPAWSLKK